MTIEMYEKTIPTAQRILNGQYYTPATVCDLMLALTLREKTQTGQRILEPSCGIGAFLARGLARFNEQASQNPATESVYPPVHEFVGIELDPHAAELARNSLQAISAKTHFQIHIEDFLSSAMNSLGCFDVIIGNPPYVRQEHMAQSTTLHKHTAVHQLMQKYEHYLIICPAQKTLFNQTADLYIWFFLQAASMLKPGGKLAFITSNSWLNTAYGQAFRQFLLHHFHIQYLLESACERWFKDAAINSIIIILEKKHEPNDSPNSPPTQVIRFHQPLAQWMPIPDIPNYWQQLDSQIEQFDTNPHVDMKALSAEQLQSYSNNWALPLRAPQSLSSLLEHKTLWLRLDELGAVRYPMKTGINRFFYLSQQQAKQWNIEDEFLFPVIRSARKIKHYSIREVDCDEFLFACPYTLEQLTQADKTGALAYIEWGSLQTSPPRQKRAEPIAWPQVPSVQQANRPWYSVKPLPPAHILCNRFIDRRFFFAQCQGNLMEDQTFYGLTLFDTETHPPALIGALLNSTLSFLIMELNGRTSLGEGVLQYARCDMAALPVLTPGLFSADEQNALINKFQCMARRSILSMPDEVQCEDRMALDNIILGVLIRHLGLSTNPLEFREQIVTPLLNRISERQTLARCFRKKTQG